MMLIYKPKKRIICLKVCASLSIKSESKQNKNKASGGKISMAEIPHKFPKTHTKCFTLTKWPEFCEMVEEDIFYRQKKSYDSHQKVTGLIHSTHVQSTS